MYSKCKYLIYLRHCFLQYTYTYTLEEFTDEQLTSQKQTADEGIQPDFQGKSDEAAISNNLEFPCVPDHEVEVGVLVDGGRDAAVVVQELGRCDLSVPHSVGSLPLHKSFL